MRKSLLKIILAFSSLLFLAVFLVMPVTTAEEAGTQQEKESAEVTKLTGYNALTGAELIKVVQLILQDSGFDPGPIDGVFGRRSREATKSFQMKNGLEPTGELDKDTIDTLFGSF